MPDVNELKEIMGNLDQMRLGLDDTFRFKCYGCGKCCKNREDILLNSWDLFRLAKHMKKTPEEVIALYCESYIGKQSHIPIVRLQPVGKNKVCPLLKENRCSVHASKPTVCALFPLGRFSMGSANNRNKPLESGYFVQPVFCGGHKQTTVRAYLESFGIPLEDVFHTNWNEALYYLSDFCAEAMCKLLDESIMRRVWGIIYNQLYICYDTELEFLPQFSVNFAKVRKAFEGIRKGA